MQYDNGKLKKITVHVQKKRRQGDSPANMNSQHNLKNITTKDQTEKTENQMKTPTQNQTPYTLGIDIGSTTVKIAVLDGDNHILFSDYERHFANIQETLALLLKKAKEQLGPLEVHPSITGSGGLTLSSHLQVPFTQEVVAVATALQDYAPQTDVAIELGGEDAKIIYFTGGIDQRMNGICAGGTGSFIDQMASLLQTDASGLNDYAKNYQMIYPIAARCGVFAKSDIQPLINEGATREDLSASIFQAVVNQTISGLACGKPIRGTVAFLGGPLHFLPELRKAFIRTLNLDQDHIVAPDHSHLFAAVGSAMNAKEDVTVSLDHMIDQLSSGIKMEFELVEGDLATILWTAPADQTNGPRAVDWDICYAANAALSLHEYYDRYRTGSPTNSHTPEDAELNRLIDATNASADVNAQNEAFKELIKYENENLFTMALYYQPIFLITSDKIGDIQKGTPQFCINWGIQNWNVQ